MSTNPTDSLNPSYKNPGSISSGGTHKTLYWGLMSCLAMAAIFMAGTVLWAADEALSIGKVRKNANAVGKYEKLELTIPIQGLQFENPYNPEEMKC